MVTYRLATEDDYKNINDFYNCIYKSNRTLEQFYWEFHNCPFGKSIYVIAEDGQRIVGTNCVIPIKLINSNNEITLTGKSEDTLVDPNYRGQNIFNNIYDFLFAKSKEHDIKVIWGYTSAKKPFKKLGFSVPFDHQQSLIVNHIWESYKYLSSLNSKNGFSQKAQIFALCAFSKLKFIINYLSIQQPDYKVTEDKVIVDQVDSLIERSASDCNDSFYILQNQEFQQWRIYQNPNYHKVHTFGFYDKKERLIAVIVLNSHQNAVAYIIQSTFDKSLTSRDRVLILKWVVNKIFSLGISIIRNWHFNTNKLNKNEIDIYQKANFISLKKGIGFVWKEIDSTNLNPNNFYLSRVSTQGVI
jgi:hypothetical protein